MEPEYRPPERDTSLLGGVASLLVVPLLAFLALMGTADRTRSLTLSVLAAIGGALLGGAICSVGVDLRKHSAGRAILFSVTGATVGLVTLLAWFASIIPGEPGRPLRGIVGTHRARRAKRGDWTAPLDVANATRDATLAAKWERAALAEHASVASFAQLSLDLLELGAPPDLIRRCHLAAIEEIDHAKKSFALASVYGGEAVGPGALPVPRIRRRATFARVKRESIVDGCMNEARAAEDLRAEAERQTDARIREMLSRIADDEEGHVRLAEDVVRFCTERDRMSA